MEGKGKNRGNVAMDKTFYHLSKRRKHGKYWLLVFFLVFLIQSCKKDKQEIRVLFTGDILLSRNVNEEIKTRKTSPWEELKPLFQSADLVIGNLEGAVGKQEEQLQSITNSPVFDIELVKISLLRDAGFNMITIENNHNYDLGKNGRKKTIESLRNFNLTPVFYENSPQFITIKDVVIAIITLNVIPGRNFAKNKLPDIEIQQKLRLAGSLANIVIVSIHWGSELLDWPSREQRETAKWLIQNGADVIIGSHPHVIQKPEMIDGKPVFFSLGNHLFDQKYPATKEGLIADLRVSNGKLKCFGIATHTITNSFYPRILENIIYDFEPVPLKRNSLFIQNYCLLPFSESGNEEGRISLEAFREGEKIWGTHPMSIIAVTSSKLDGKNEFLFILEKHYSSIDHEYNLRPYVYQVDDHGIVARWRGSALAWPLLDAVVAPFNPKIICALHRGDSFINLDKSNSKTRIAAYKWNGFGFTGVNDSIICESCSKIFRK